MADAALAEGGVSNAARQRGRAPKPSQAEASAEATPDQAGASGQALKVLFVDDEEYFVRTMAECMLMRDLGGDVANI